MTRLRTLEELYNVELKQLSEIVAESKQPRTFRYWVDQEERIQSQGYASLAWYIMYQHQLGGERGRRLGDLGEELGYSRNQVKNMMIKMNIPRMTNKDIFAHPEMPDKEKVEELYASGWSHRMVGKEFGKTRSQMARIAKEYEIKRPEKILRGKYNIKPKSAETKSD